MRFDMVVHQPTSTRSVSGVWDRLRITHATPTNAEYTVLASVKAIQAAAGCRRIEHATPGLWLTALVAIGSNRGIFTAYVDGNDDDDSTDVD